MSFLEYLNARAMRNASIDTIVGRTQRNLTYLYWFLFALVLAALVFLPRPMDESSRTVLQMLLAILGTLITQQSSFWFARVRTAGVPDPTQVVTQTKTTPDGTKTTVTSPATKPAPQGIPHAPTSTILSPLAPPAA